MTGPKPPENAVEGAREGQLG